MRQKPPRGLVHKPESLVSRFVGKVGLVSKTLLKAGGIPLALCGLIFLFYFWLLSTSRLERFENIFLDYFFRERPPIAANPSLVYIEIAEDSIQKIGRWPWPRYYHAAMAHLLHEWGAQAIVFDILFSEESALEDDHAFEEALGQARRQVYLPVIFEDKKWVHSLPRFERHALAVGHINITPDEDGVLRRIEPSLTRDGKTYPQLGLQVAFDQIGQRIPSERPFPFPLDSKGNFLINWAGKWQESFEHYSYVDLIKSFEELQKGKKPLVDPSSIKGKICLIGLTALGHTDIRATPLQTTYPAVGVHANVINSILTRQFVRPAGLAQNRAALGMIGCLSLIFFFPFRNVLSTLAVLGIAVSWVGSAFLVFWKLGIFFYVFHPLLLVFSLFVFSAVYALLLANKEKFRFFELATRDGLTGLYVIRHFRILLNEAVREAKEHQEPLSVILIDIDNFKKINDTYGHQAGDMVLKSLALQVQSFTRYKRTQKEEDYVARYGGEEIIVMLRKSNLTDAAFNVAERIRKGIEGMKLTWEKNPIPVTVSLGVSTLNSSDDDTEALIRRADGALYRAKEEGKNRVCVQT